MRRLLNACLMVTLFCVALASPATAEIKWIQNPDPTVNGVQVEATWNGNPAIYIVADDFECRSTGAINEICIWGGWAHDAPPMMDPQSVEFVVAIHADIPADQSPTGYSMPGEALWIRSYVPGEFSVIGGPTGVFRGWLAPPTDYWWPCCENVYTYCFPINELQAFIQQGTPAEPVVYWVAIQATPLVETDKFFGWLSSQDHWNDNATWAEGLEPITGGWGELVYPQEHPWAGQPIDLAFSIDGEVNPEEADWGDAPDIYHTLAANNGAAHVIVQGYYLGGAIDGEPDGQLTGTGQADGDDINGIDDEDGVNIVMPLVEGETAQLDVFAQAPGYLDAWIDFDQNGDWDGSDEYIFASVPLSAGPNLLSFDVPVFAAIGQTHARFRFSSSGGLTYQGIAEDGEVEDYAWDIHESENWKYEQLPDLTPYGMDVNASPGPEDYILAEDFLCLEPGPLTDFHVFGSWYHDLLPFGGDPSAVKFTLSIHADIPVQQPDTPYSRPGEVLWYHEFQPGEFEVEIVAEQIDEGWFDAPDLYEFPGDHICWVYKFHVDPHLAFHQEGTEYEGIVYWLDVKAEPLDPETRWGWKTTINQWNDDAVWGIGAEPYPGPWFELAYPPTHEFYGQPLGLAFRLFMDRITAAPEEVTPRRSHLRQNVPNPFNPQTVIEYTVPVDGLVRLDVFDPRGRLVRTLVDTHQSAGPRSATWDGRNDHGQSLPSGVYYCRLRTAQVEEAVKMIMLR